MPGSPRHTPRADDPARRWADLSTDEQRRAVDGIRDFIFAAQGFRVAAAEHFDVGIRETEAIGYLDIHGQLTAGELAQQLYLSPGTVTDLLARLDRAGLAVRTSDEKDQRRAVIALTSRGHEVVAEIREWLASCFAGIADVAGAVEDFALARGSLQATGDRLRSGRDVSGTPPAGS